MEYSINALVKLAGISVRTLHYYDEIKLLTPGRISSNGYRVYGEKEVDSLQQILFYRELGLPLDEISQIMHAKLKDSLERRILGTGSINSKLNIAVLVNSDHYYL